MHLGVLIHDRDTKFSGPFEEVFSAEGTRVILTPVGAPYAKTYAERWVRTVRVECLDWVLVWSRRYLVRVLREYTNTTTVRGHTEAWTCGHLGLLRSASNSRNRNPSIRRRDRLGGLLHEYYLEVLQCDGRLLETYGLRTAPDQPPPRQLSGWLADNTRPASRSLVGGELLAKAFRLSGPHGDPDAVRGPKVFYHSAEAAYPQHWGVSPRNARLMPLSDPQHVRNPLELLGRDIGITLQTMKVEHCIRFRGIKVTRPVARH